MFFKFILICKSSLHIFSLWKLFCRNVVICPKEFSTVQIFVGRIPMVLFSMFFLPRTCGTSHGGMKDKCLIFDFTVFRGKWMVFFWRYWNTHTYITQSSCRKETSSQPARLASIEHFSHELSTETRDGHRLWSEGQTREQEVGAQEDHSAMWLRVSGFSICYEGFLLSDQRYLTQGLLLAVCTRSAKIQICWRRILGV